MRQYTAVFIAIVSIGCTGQVLAQSNGFDLSNATVPVAEIFRGGPPRDGIPAILKPKFESVDEADEWLRPGDRVIGLTLNGESVCYPQRITIWHELVNDTVGGAPVVVTYCPLCGSSMVFEREVDSTLHTFGVSGLLYNSDVLMYDHQTESLWSQLKMEAVSGPEAGQKLTLIPSLQTTWAEWKRKHPDTRVLSGDEDSYRNYSATPYANYMKSPDIMFPVPFDRTELAKKDWVMGVIVDGTAKAYPLEALARSDSNPVRDTVAGVDLELDFNNKAKSLSATRLDTGEPVPVVRAYWFAWQAFYPETKLYARSTE